MNDPATALPADLLAAKPTWREDLVLVCRKCQKNSAGVDGKPLSKWLRRELKSRGQGKRFRVVRVDCLDLCPKNAVTLLRGSDIGRSAKPLQVFRDGEDPQRLMDWLLGAKSPLY
jgi:predicted metal-binding protein